MWILYVNTEDGRTERFWVLSEKELKAIIKRELAEYSGEKYHRNKIIKEGNIYYGNKWDKHHIWIKI